MSIAINVFLSFIHKISVILCFCKNTLTSEVILMYKPRYSDNMNSHSDLIDADISAFEYYVFPPSDVKEPVRRCRKMSAHSETAAAAVSACVRTFLHTFRLLYRTSRYDIHSAELLSLEIYSSLKICHKLVELNGVE